MTNETLERMIRMTDISKGKILLPGKAILCSMPGHILYYDKPKKNYVNTPDYEYIVLIDNNVPVGGILNCFNDVHWTIFPEFRGKHYLSNFLRSFKLSDFWINIKSLSWCDSDLYIFEHLTSLSGYEIKDIDKEYIELCKNKQKGET